MSTATSRSPVFAVVPAAGRAHANHGWLDTYYSFSFADYYDPENENWGALRVFNDDTIAGGAGFPAHPHRDMEIVTYVLSGELAHRDSMGNHGVVGAGGVQFMSAGTGVTHSEYNNNADEPLHLVQMWVLPGRLGMPPAYGEMAFDVEREAQSLARYRQRRPRRRRADSHHAECYVSRRAARECDDRDAVRTGALRLPFRCCRQRRS